MRRREFIAGLGSAAALPVVARAQQSAIPIIAYLSVRSAESDRSMMAAFRRGLKPFRQYQLRFGVMCWDGRWTYIRFEFIHNGEVMAVGHTKGGIIGSAGIVGSAEMCQVLGIDPASAAFPPSVLAWIEADRLMRA